MIPRQTTKNAPLRFWREPLLGLSVLAPLLIFALIAVAYEIFTHQLDKQRELMAQQHQRQTLVHTLVSGIIEEDAQWQSFINDYPASTTDNSWPKLREENAQLVELTNELLLASQADDALYEDVRLFSDLLHQTWIAYQEARAGLFQGQLNKEETYQYSQALSDSAQMLLLDLSVRITREASASEAALQQRVRRNLQRSTLLATFLVLPVLLLSVYYIRRAFVHRQRTTDTLTWMVDHDPLTHLPERHLWLRRATTLSAKGTTVVALVSIRNFREINQSHGTNIQSTLLKLFAQRMQSLLGPDATLCRVFGADFILCVPTDQQPEHWLTQLIAQLEQPITLEDFRHELRLQAGACLNTDALPADKAQQAAEVAIVSIPPEQKIHWFHPNQSAALARRKEIKHALQQALQANTFELVYQPQITLDNGKCEGVEVLLRWPQLDGSYISPAEFIPVAEESGLMPAIGWWVVRTAIQQWRQWQTNALPLNKIAINLSAAQLRQPDFARELIALVRAQELEPAHIVLELTESIYAIDVEPALRELRQYGFRLSIDDFGTGYSNFGYLERLAPDILKIDRQFVSDLHQLPHKAAMTQGIVDLARRLEMVTIAEGAELEDELARLRAMGCSAVQGYVFSPPLKPDALEAFVRATAAAKGDEPQTQ